MQQLTWIILNSTVVFSWSLLSLAHSALLPYDPLQVHWSATGSVFLGIYSLKKRKCNSGYSPGVIWKNIPRKVRGWRTNKWRIKERLEMSCFKKIKWDYLGYYVIYTLGSWPFFKKWSSIHHTITYICNKSNEKCHLLEHWGLLFKWLTENHLYD